jgi:hypothetical protein
MDQLPSYDDIDIIMTKSENEIVQHMTNKGWGEYESEIVLYSKNGVRLFHHDKNKNGKVEMNLDELSPSDSYANFENAYNGEYSKFFKISMRKTIKYNKQVNYIFFRLLTDELETSQRRLQIDGGNQIWERIKSFGLTKCVKRNSMYNSSYFFDESYCGVDIYRLDSDFAQSVLESERKANF